MRLPMRFLMVLDKPWDRNLGAPRVQMELAHELRESGHIVDKSVWFDAFPRATSSKLGSKLHALAGRAFSTQAGAFVRSVARHYDIIESQQGNLPFTKAELGFDGLLVERSIGLADFYREFERSSRERWPDDRGSLPGRALHWWVDRRKAPRDRRSLEVADLINLPNSDELRFVQEALALGDKAVLLPNALEERHLARLREGADSADARLARPLVVFIGWWSPRKGSRDWMEIIARVRQELPATRFRFLGTGGAPGRVRATAGIADAEVIPYFDSEDLPMLLRDATVGALPTYVEGFGLGVIEQLAAGIPSVAYDSPGPRDTLPRVDPSFLTPPGDTNVFAARILRLLRASPVEYSQLADRCIREAQHFSWKHVAPLTLDAYMSRLEQIRG